MLQSIFNIDGLIDIIRREHAFTPARGFGSVERLERRTGLRLPQSMLSLYAEFDGVRLFGNEYVVLDPDGILPFDAVIRAHDELVPTLSPSWLSFCRTREGQWVAVDLGAHPSGGHPVAAFRGVGNGAGPAVQLIAPSFECFLAFALVGRRHPYWADLDWRSAHKGS